MPIDIEFDKHIKSFNVEVEIDLMIVACSLIDNYCGYWAEIDLAEDFINYKENVSKKNYYMSLVEKLSSGNDEDKLFVLVYYDDEVSKENGEYRKNPVVLTVKDILDAIKKMASLEPFHFNRLIKKDTDETTGNVIFQIATFGKLVFD